MNASINSPSATLLLFFFIVAMASLCAGSAVQVGEIPNAASGIESHVAPFFNAHCIGCHGPQKSKGEMTLHTLDGDLAAGQGLAP